MRIFDSRQLGGGVFPLQHESYGAKGWISSTKASILCYRILDRLTGPDDVGHWVYEAESVGDLHGGQLLKRVVTSRELSMWRFATPVIKSSSTDPISEGAGKPPCTPLSEDPNAFPVLPVFDESWNPDQRFAGFNAVVFQPIGAEDEIQMYPLDTVGISLTANNDQKQANLFFPAYMRLMAVNWGGDHRTGTLVYDQKGSSSIDFQRAARLQSAFRVCKKPLGQANTLAFQLNETGCNDGSFGGYFCDFPDGGDIAVEGDTNRAFARGSYVFGGLLHAGHADDKHKQGVNADGNPINPLHGWIRAPFYDTQSRDGPLKLDYFFDGQDEGYEHIVHFNWNPEFEVWDWFVRVPQNVATGSPLAEIQRRPIKNTPTDISKDRHLSYVQFWNDTAFSSVLAKPTPTRSGRFRLNNRFPAAKKRFEKREMEQLAIAPICGQFVAFGSEGGPRLGVYGNAQTGASRDSWNYTQKPKDSKYVSGTANGGWVILPPEVNPNDHSNGYAPNGVTCSTVYCIAGPNVSWGVGIPEISDGSIQDGFSWGMDTSNGDMVIQRHANGAIAEEAGRWANSNGLFTWAQSMNVQGALEIDGNLNHDGVNIGFFGGALSAQIAHGSDFTNNVTSGGVNDQVDDFTDLSTYSNDAATIRNDIYQLARSVKVIQDALRDYGLLS